jgi:hypothetical protein
MLQFRCEGHFKHSTEAAEIPGVFSEVAVEQRAIRKLAGTLIGQPELLGCDFTLLASTDIQSGLVANSSVDAGRLLLHYHRVLGQDASQIQRQHLFEFSHYQDFPFGICFPIERHHASHHLERYDCSK